MVPGAGEDDGAASAAMPGGAGRPFLRIWFGCANQYQRAYKHADGSQYSARCPKCGQMVRFPVGPGGTNERFFEVRCD
jgi:hypothetical protein